MTTSGLLSLRTGSWSGSRVGSDLCEGQGLGDG